MDCFQIPLTVDYAAAGLSVVWMAFDHPKPVLNCYCQSGKDDFLQGRRRPAVVICPGGGYAFVSKREAEPIALQFAAAGFQAFVLWYSVDPSPFPAALLELSASVALIRERAEEWNVDPNRITVCGFSAGGHLAASLGVFWNRDFVTAPLGLHNSENQPNSLVLAYPVILCQAPFTHPGSMQNLLGENPSNEKLEQVSLEKQVTGATPPCFLWHTGEDETVPVENSMEFASALRANGVPFELHIYQYGKHGLSLANELTATGLDQIVPGCQGWIGKAISWINALT